MTDLCITPTTKEHGSNPRAIDPMNSLVHQYNHISSLGSLRRRQRAVGGPWEMFLSYGVNNDSRGTDNRLDKIRVSGVDTKAIQ